YIEACKQGKHAERSELHYNVDDVENDHVYTVKEFLDRAYFLRLCQNQGDPKKDREEDDLEHVRIISGGAKEIFRNDIDKRLQRSLSAYLVCGGNTLVHVRSIGLP